jgi:hypothetical protein
LSSAEAIVEQARRTDPARATTESLIGKLLFADVLKNAHVASRAISGSLKRRPIAAFPVASAGMFTPSVVLAFLPLPIVRMDDYAGRRWIGVVLVDMPAIAVGVADDSCGRD